MTRFCVAMLATAIAFGTSACSKHDDSSASATDAPTAASDAGAVIASPTIDASPVSTASTDAGSANATAVASGGDPSQLVRANFAMYPNATLENDQLLDATVNNAHTMAGELTTNDDFDVVDAWYKAHLTSFTRTHVKVGDLEESTYTTGSDASLPHYTATIERVKADAENKASTKIVIAIKEVAK